MAPSVPWSKGPKGGEERPYKTLDRRVGSEIRDTDRDVAVTLFCLSFTLGFTHLNLTTSEQTIGQRVKHLLITLLTRADSVAETTVECRVVYMDIVC